MRLHSPMTKQKPLRVCGILAAALLPIAALAATPRAADPAALDVDQSIQKLKEQSLDVIQQAQAVEQTFLYPDYNRVSLYVGVRIPGMLIKDISASIDDSAPVSYQYHEAESVTLQDRGLHLLLRINAAPGRHHLKAQYTAQYSDARPSDPPFTGSYDGYFDKTQQPAELELGLQRQGYLTRPELIFHDWRVSQ